MRSFQKVGHQKEYSLERKRHTNHIILIGQAFMKRDQSVRKYLVVDGGEYTDELGVPVMQVYHLGFIFKDEFGTSKFSRGFSLVFHNGELS